MHWVVGEVGVRVVVLDLEQAFYRGLVGEAVEGDRVLVHEERKRWIFH